MENSKIGYIFDKTTGEFLGTEIVYLEKRTGNYPHADNITFNKDGFAKFDVFNRTKNLGNIELSVPGIHNVSNSLAAISLSIAYGIKFQDIKSALSKFTGAHRRFEYKGKIDNKASVYDDYGHHPTEIMATINSLKNKEFNKSWVIFQPHTYSRTKNLLTEFAEALINFDNIIILDIYAAREKNTYEITSKDLVQKIESFGKKAKYIPDFDECVNFVKSHVEQNDIIITLGAGTVTKIGPMLVD